MGLAHRIHGGGRGRAGEDNVSVVRRPRLYEITTAISFSGRRRAIYDDLVELSGAARGDRVLDVGCGPGYLTRRAAKAVGPSGRVEGIDPSPDAIAYATRTAPVNATFRVAGAEQLPYPDDTFDVVISSLAIHHIHPDQVPVALGEMGRVLRQGGRLLIADFRPPRNNIAKKLIGRLSGHGSHHNPIDQLPGLIAGAGFLVAGQGDRRHRLRYIQATASGEAPRATRAREGS